MNIGSCFLGSIALLRDQKYQLVKKPQFYGNTFSICGSLRPLFLQCSSPRKPSSNVCPCPLSAIEPASVYWASLVAQLVKNPPATWEA